MVIVFPQVGCIIVGLRPRDAGNVLGSLARDYVRAIPRRSMLERVCMRWTVASWGSSAAGTNYKVMKKAFDEGWGGVTCKTLSLDSSQVNNVTPRYGRMKASDGQVIGCVRFNSARNGRVGLAAPGYVLTGA
jgi:hypothetical protein